MNNITSVKEKNRHWTPT